jgi:hypothetical protein
MNSRVLALLVCATLAAWPSGLAQGRPSQDDEPVAGASDLAPLPTTVGKLGYTIVPPCRIIDTRQAGGSLPAGAPRDFRVTGVGLQGQGGNQAGCGIPQGPAKAAILNFVAVNPAGPGNLKGWAYSSPPVDPPNASILNYAAVSGLNIANGIAVPLCEGDAAACPFDLRVQADGNGSQLVVDVVGYFTPQTTFVVETPIAPTFVPLTTTCATYQSVTLDVPSGGKVVVQVIAEVYVQHEAGLADDVTAHIAANNTECLPLGGGRTFRRFVAAAFPSYEGPETYSFSRVFTVPTAGSYTFHLNALATPSSGPGFLEGIQNYRMIATFMGH